MSDLLRASVLAILLVLVSSSGPALAGPSAGVEPGVHVDPGSPAAKEYALPLSQARKTGGPPGGGGLFGAGIHRSASARHLSGPRRTGRASAQRGGRGPVRRRSAAAGGSGVSATSVRAPAAGGGETSGGDSLLALLGGGVAVLIVGALGGTILRRRPRAGAPRA